MSQKNRKSAADVSAADLKGSIGGWKEPAMEIAITTASAAATGAAIFLVAGIMALGTEAGRKVGEKYFSPTPTAE